MTGSRIGAALTIGTGDIDSRGAQIKTQNDATFYGLSLYSKHDLDGLSLKGNPACSGVNGSYEGVEMGEKSDVDAFSAALRYADDCNGTEIRDVNAIEMPVGIAFEGRIVGVSGWIWVPEFDVSVVPRIGDDKAEVVNAGAPSSSASSKGRSSMRRSDLARRRRISDSASTTRTARAAAGAATTPFRSTPAGSSKPRPSRSGVRI